MMRTGAVVAAAQRRPLEMLHKMLPELMLSMASEACLGLVTCLHAGWLLMCMHHPQDTFLLL